MRPLAPVRVRRDDQRWRGWKAVCRVCGQSATTTPHAEALAWAHGHMHVRHPGWQPRQPRAWFQSLCDFAERLPRREQDMLCDWLEEWL